MEHGSDGEKAPLDQARSRADRLLEELLRHQREVNDASARAVAPEVAAEGKRRIERAVAAVERLRAALWADEL